MKDVITCERQSGIAILTLNRPEKLNALSYDLLDRLAEWLDTLELDAGVRALVITGAGEAFSAGADIAGFAPSVAAGGETALRDFCRRGQDVTRRLEGYPKPIVAAVNGLAYGGGCEIAEAMALTVASDEARFCKAEIRLGLLPVFGGTQRLPRLVGRKRALEMILTGEPIDAHRAHEIGLVNRVVPRHRVLPEAIALAASIARFPPVAVEACLNSVNRGLEVALDEGLAIEASEFARTLPGGDLAEGIAAFLGKRTPCFPGCGDEATGGGPGSVS